MAKKESQKERFREEGFSSALPVGQAGETGASYTPLAAVRTAFVRQLDLVVGALLFVVGRQKTILEYRRLVFVAVGLLRPDPVIEAIVRRFIFGAAARPADSFGSLPLFPGRAISQVMVPKRDQTEFDRICT